MAGAVIADVELPDFALLIRLYCIWASEQKGQIGRLREGRSDFLGISRRAWVAKRTYVETNHTWLIHQSMEQKVHKMLRFNQADVTHWDIRRCNSILRAFVLLFFLLAPVIPRKPAE